MSKANKNTKIEELNIIKDYYKTNNLKIEYIGEGWHNRIYLINRKDVFRLTATEHGRDKMSIYNKVSPMLKLPINIPRFKTFNIISNNKYKAFAIYTYHKGNCVNFDKLDENSILKLAQSMSIIHNFKYENTFGKYNITVELEQQFENLSKYVFSYLNKNEQLFIEKLYNDYLKSSISQKVKLVFIHGDLNAKNLLQNNNALSCILDWDNIQFNDPMFDFSRFPFKFFNKIIEMYPNKEALNENLIERYLFYRMRKHTYKMYYSSVNPLYADKHLQHIFEFRKVKKDYEKHYMEYINRFEKTKKCDGIFNI